MKVFVLEDDESWQFIYQETLSSRFDLSLFSSLAEIDPVLSAQTEPYVLLADLNLNGESFVSYLRAHPDLPKLAKILVLSATDAVDTLEECFALGVSDYLTKPIKVPELLVKTKRLSELAMNKGSLGLEVDWMSNRVTYKGAEVQLTPREFQILNFLITRGDMGVPKADLLHSIWKNTNVTSNTVEVHLCNMRKKLDSIGFEIATRPPNTFYLTAAKQQAAAM